MNNCRVLLADDEAAILEGYKLLFDWEKYQCGCGDCHGWT